MMERLISILRMRKTVDEQADDDCAVDFSSHEVFCFTDFAHISAGWALFVNLTTHRAVAGIINSNIDRLHVSKKTKWMDVGSFDAENWIQAAGRGRHHIPKSIHIHLPQQFWVENEGYRGSLNAMVLMRMMDFGVQPTKRTDFVQIGLSAIFTIILGGCFLGLWLIVINSVMMLQNF